MSITKCGIAELNARRAHHRPRAHLLGIGGSGMRAMAEVLLGWGWQLSGSDLRCEPALPLAAAGVRLSEGHTAENLPPDVDLVIASDAVTTENLERRRAIDLGIPVLSYFQAIGQLSETQSTLAIAGTHGKSTTTAMAAHVLTSAGCDPTVFCGAAMPGGTSGGRAGQREDGLMVVEACEYRANFLHLRPRQAAILGIEPDHFDCYDTMAQLEEAFGRFAALTPSDGVLLARHDCPATRRAIAGAACRVETFGFDPAADWSARDMKSDRGRYGFSLWRGGCHVGNVTLPIPGQHNVLNALAALALTSHQGISPKQGAASLAEFRGLERRFDVSEIGPGVTLIDDYAHHPTEVTVTLATVRESFPNRRVWVVFQPHQASRTTRLLDELAESLQNADKVLVASIFRAREGVHSPGEVTAADLATRARAHGANVFLCHSTEEIVKTLEIHLVPGDVLAILGAGDTMQFRPFG